MFGNSDKDEDNMTAAAVQRRMDDGGEGAAFEFIYTNWRGETSTRRARPVGVWFGISEYHPEPQWFLKAFDYDKKAVRDFALAEIAGQKSVVLRQDHDGGYDSAGNYTRDQNLPVSAVEKT